MTTEVHELDLLTNEQHRVLNALTSRSVEVVKLRLNLGRGQRALSVVAVNRALHRLTELGLAESPDGAVSYHLTEKGEAVRAASRTPEAQGLSWDSPHALLARRRFLAGTSHTSPEAAIRAGDRTLLDWCDALNAARAKETL